jgi:hypothetical protein
LATSFLTRLNPEEPLCFRIWSSIWGRLPLLHKSLW